MNILNPEKFPILSKAPLTGKEEMDIFFNSLSEEERLQGKEEFR